MNQYLPFADEQRRLRRGAWLLGFALGGFFDGILLHQILQWHHLLSAVDDARLDLGMQIVADGLFHALMYLIALAGLWQLSRARNALSIGGANREVLASALYGFGIWHVLDTLLSHWLLGLHRVRMDVDNPWLWDLIWLAAFGLLALLIARAVRRGGGSAGGSNAAGGGRSGKDAASSGKGSASALVLVLSGATLLLGWQAAQPDSAGGDARHVTVVMRAGSAGPALFAALPEIDARVIWGSSGGDVWVLALGAHSRPLQLYQHGALWVGGSFLPAGCSAWLYRRA